MALLQHGALQPNNWRFVGDDAAIPAEEPVTVSLKRWQAESETLRGRNTPIGVRLKNDEQALALGDDVHRLSLIEVEFPKFTDGRAFSQARILRDKLGYKGELRGGRHHPARPVSLHDPLRHRLQSSCPRTSRSTATSPRSRNSAPGTSRPPTAA